MLDSRVIKLEAVGDRKTSSQLIQQNSYKWH